MKAEIITIGDEILIGQIVDTNAAWIAKQFNDIGIEIFQVISVHDDSKQIINALRSAEKNVDIVIITGGLGPTKDDLTKKTLCQFFNTELVFDKVVFEQVKERLSNRNIKLNGLNKDQAMVPSNCTILNNKMGTAPGMWFEKDGTIFISLPGVPFEMEYLMKNEIIPRLSNLGSKGAIFHKTIKTQGIAESVLAVKIEDWENKLPDNIRLAYLPNPAEVRLRLSAIGKNIEDIEYQVDKEIKKLQKIIPEYIFGYDNETLAEVIGRLLSKNNKNLAVAESCTGGYISHLITLVPGCSEWYKGSVTSYSNEIKMNVLGVSEKLLEKYGAVSKQVVIQMAEGLKRCMNVDYTVATSGIAGPSGGTMEKPVGTVWIAVADRNKTIAEKFLFGDNRERNIIRGANTALHMLKRVIDE